MSSKTILLADDEEAILASISWALEKNNFSVTTAKNGDEAIDFLKARYFDLVITDLVMPVTDGLEVLEQAKRLYSEIGVIILTGYGDIDSAIQALRLGADDYLQKPCDIDDLLNKIRHSLERRDLLSRLRLRNEQLQNEIAARQIVETKLKESQAHLEQKVAQRTADLSKAVAELETTLTALMRREKELREKNLELQDINTTLNTLLKRREYERDAVRKEIAVKAVETVLPLLKKVKNQTTGQNRSYMETAQANLLEVVSAHSNNTLLGHAKLTPRELQIIHYIRQNKTSKEISELLNLSVRTVEYYRDNIRKKLRIKNRKKNLRKFVTSIP